MPIARRSVVLGIASGALLVASRGRAQLRATPSSVVGPFYPDTYMGEVDNDLTLVTGRTGRAAGEVIEVAGRVLDLRGNPVAGARIEMWQANAAGRYDHPRDSNPAPLDPNFQGFARFLAGPDGIYRYTTIKPGAYPDGWGSPRPPHIHLDIEGSGGRLVTQMIFPDEPLNETDDVIRRGERPGLIASARGRGASGALRFEWDIVLDQG